MRKTGLTLLSGVKVTPEEEDFIVRETEEELFFLKSQEELEELEDQYIMYMAQIQKEIDEAIIDDFMFYEKAKLEWTNYKKI